MGPSYEERLKARPQRGPTKGVPLGDSFFDSFCESPSKRDPSRTARMHMIGLIASGNFPDIAAMMVGVTRQRLEGWLVKGAKGLQPYADFHREVEEAQATSLGTLALTVNRVARGDADNKPDGKLGLDILKARDKRWNPQTRILVESMRDQFFAIAKRTLEADAYERLVTAIAEGGGEEGAEEDPPGEGFRGTPAH